MGLFEVLFNEGRPKRINLNSIIQLQIQLGKLELHKLELEFSEFLGTLYVYLFLIILSILTFILEVIRYLHNINNL